MVGALKWLLVPKIEVGKLYTSSSFLLRKWFLDRLFLSPMYSFALQRSLETTSTYPLYLRLLGVELSGKVWLSYCTLRVGMELLTVEDGVHTGMQTYITTERNNKDGVSFNKTKIGRGTSWYVHHSLCYFLLGFQLTSSSFVTHISGQRSVLLSGVNIGEQATLGAESCCDHNTFVEPNGTAFGSPLVMFKSARTNNEIVLESQQSSRLLMNALSLDSATEHAHSQAMVTHSDVSDSILPFWVYALVMNLAQFIMPALIVGSYALVVAACYLSFGGFASALAIILTIPIAFIGGSITLMLVIKCLQLIFFGGKFTTGTIEFYGMKFMCWYFLSDMVFLCTQTVFVPFAGTELFCVWLRLMGSKIGKRVFFSPENGGLRELDFLHVGDDSTILTPNLNSHYADHGCMQFCPVVFSSGCEINAGATVMPLTEYGKQAILRPFSMTSKGQRCKENTIYVGNPAKPVHGNPHETTTAVLFSGLGSAHPGMFKGIESYPRALDVLEEASSILGMDVARMCQAGADPKAIEDVGVAQLLVTVMNIVSFQMMRQTNAMEMSRATIVAGFSVGEFAALYFGGAISLRDTLHLVQVQCEEFEKLRVSSTLCNVRGLSRSKVNEICKRFNCRIANVISCHEEESLRSNNVLVCGGRSSDIDRLVTHVNEMECSVNKSELERGDGGIIKKVTAKRLPVNTANREYIESLRIYLLLQLFDNKSFF